MAISPDISLAVRTPQVENPLEQAGKALSIVGMRQQQQIGQENLKSHQLANQEALLKRQDDEGIMQAWQQADGDPTKHVELAGASGKVRPQAIQALQQHYGAIVEQKAKISEAQAKAQEAQDEQVSGAVNGLLQTPDEMYPSAYAETAARLKKMYPELPIPGEVPSKDQLAHIGIAYRTNKILDAQGAEKRAQAEEQRKQAEEAQKALLRPTQVKTAESTARETGAKADIEVAKADAMKKAVADYAAGYPGAQHPIDAVLPVKLDSTANPSFKSNYDVAMRYVGPDAALKVVTEAAQHAAAIGKAVNPAIQNAEVQRAVRTKAATIPLEIKADVDKQIALSKLAPESFASIPDPRSRAAAESDYGKDTKEAADKVASAAQLQDFVAAAQSGNKAAPGLIPMSEVRQLVNRVNRQELEGVSKGAGNAVDRFEGFIKGYTEGQPIPPAVLKDIATISGVMQNAAIRAYNMKVDINNKTHGGSVKPIDFSQYTGQKGSTGALSTGHKVDDIVMVRGKKYRITKVLPDDKFEGDEVKE